MTFACTFRFPAARGLAALPRFARTKTQVLRLTTPNNSKTTQNNFSMANWRKRENSDAPPGPGRQVVGSCLSSCLSCFPIFCGMGQRSQSFLFRQREIALAPENGVTIPAPRTTFACVPPGLPAGGTASMAGRAWNVERIGNANERIHAGLQLERPSETVAGKPLAAPADAEAANPVLKLNTRKEPT